MKKPTTIALAIAAAASVSGCSEIGKVNGVDVSRVAGENPNAPYCEKNPAICIVGAAAIVGGTTLVIREITRDDDKTAGNVGGDS